jgi:ribosomal protein L11 methyltransferase
MQYTEAVFTVDPREPWTEILIAELAEIGFESFEPTPEGVKGYAKDEDFDADAIASMLERYRELVRVTYNYGKVETVNWNEVWEKNYAPVVIDDQCGIRAPFHAPRPDLRYDILIEPKMSFGTAHHDTTALMIRWLLKTEVMASAVLDMGCGTGVLAILAAMKGADPVLAMDNYIWAYDNTIENIRRNGLSNVEAIHGDASTLSGMQHSFDLILANINRNVLLEDLSVYVQKMNPGGRIILSGFFREDEPALLERAQEEGLKRVDALYQNQWASVCYQK